MSANHPIPGVHNAFVEPIGPHYRIRIALTYSPGPDWFWSKDGWSPVNSKKYGTPEEAEADFLAARPRWGSTIVLG